MLQMVTRPRRRGFLAAVVTAATRPRRTLVLPLVGCVVGLGIAGLNLFHVVQKPRTTVPPGYAALVNGQPILMSDFLNELQDDTSKPFEQTTQKERATELKRMINEELLVQRGLALNLPETLVEVRTALSDGVNAQVAAPVRANRPTDAMLKKYYKAHRADYITNGTMALDDIVLHYGSYRDVDQTRDQAMADAAEAVFDLRAGSNLQHVMQHFGFVRSGKMKDGTELDFAAKIYLGPKLFAVASKLTDGQVSDPVSAPDGVHVLVMKHRELPTYTDFSDVRSNVYTSYMSDAQKRVQRKNLQFLHSHARIFVAGSLKDLEK